MLADSGSGVYSERSTLFASAMIDLVVVGGGNDVARVGISN